MTNPSSSKKLVLFAASLTLTLFRVAHGDPLGTAFTYQAQLQQGAAPMNGTADFRFTLHGAPPAGGPQVAPPLFASNVLVSNGLVNFELDFGVDVFDGSARWLQVAIRAPHDPSDSLPYTTLNPRQPITPTPYALQCRGIFVNTAGQVNIAKKFTVTAETSEALAIQGDATAPNGDAVGVKGTTLSPDGSGIQGSGPNEGICGEATAMAGPARGVCGTSMSMEGEGVMGHAMAPSGATCGVKGMADSPDGTGVVGMGGAEGMHGEATETGGTAVGVVGMSASTEGEGIMGVATAKSGATCGVKGMADSPAGTGVVGEGGAEGVHGEATQTSGTAVGVCGTSASMSGEGVLGYAMAPLGATCGVKGMADSPTGTGVVGMGGEEGVHGEATETSGIAVGVCGRSASTTGEGVLGEATSGTGTTYGVRGMVNSPTGYAGYFEGRGYFSGNVGVGTTDPQEPLDVGGNIHASGTIKSGSSITLDGTAGAEKIVSSDALELHTSTGRALRMEPEVNATSYSMQVAAPNILGGWDGNTITSGVAGATIGGGGADDAGLGSSIPNGVTDDFGTVGGGAGNQAGDAAGTTGDRPFNTVGGGAGNYASGSYSTVGGGQNNYAPETNSTVGGGWGNAATGSYSTVGGGAGNYATKTNSTVGGGYANRALGSSSTVGGGWRNQPVGDYSTVPGGFECEAGGDYSFAAGRQARVRSTALGDAADDHGTFMWADNTAAYFISSGPNQFLIRASGNVGINTNAPTATLHIGGTPGGTNGIRFPDGTLQTTAPGGASTAWGLTGNAGTSPGTNFLGTTDNQALQFHVNGARALRIQPKVVATVLAIDSPNLLGGWDGNTITSGVAGATIGGGGAGDAGYGDILPNRVTDDFGTVGGGASNQAGNASGTTGDRAFATVGGGFANTVRGGYGTVGGGYANLASGEYSTVPGGSSNQASGQYSFAAGRQANAIHNGAFVWADSTATNVASTAANQFLVRASGGIWLGTTSTPSIAAGRFIDTSTGGYLTTGGVWTDSSDRDAKENFEPLDARSVLDRLADIPITRWNFKVQDASVQHIGPVAQDFHAAFSTGEDDQHLAALDTAGVALAAIQGLYEIVQEKDCRIEELEAKLSSVEELEAKLASLETLVAKLASQQNGDGR